ncbi:MAG: MMPL family transporter [Prevotella sp.]|nr:MMPL family transporter [Prevotella sp.]
MTRLIIQIYDALKAHTPLRWTLLVVLTVVLCLSLTRQSYKEDISDFLPLDKGQQQAFQEYQNTSGARRIYVIFQASDSLCQAAINMFCKEIEKNDTAQMLECVAADDPEVVQENLCAIYARIPYLLTNEDYVRIDSVMSEPGFIVQKLENDKQKLMLPTAGMIALQIQHDPLNLFTPVLERIKPVTNSNQMMLQIDSPYGASETEHNAQLLSMLQQVCDSVECEFPELTVHMTGGPVIAVGNAQQIKEDSIISITIAVILIFILLWLAFRSVRNQLLIALSIGWGWLFAMGCLTLVHNNVSIIILGISSVILGIAVNYPLHLIIHLSHHTDTRSALKEIVTPLVVGNVTTVGAFLALVPLDSVALRDLGLFSAFLLIGTILFVLLWLPHMVHHSSKKTKNNIFERVGDVKLEKKPWLVYTVMALTVVFGFLSLQTTFDADLRNINYMTDEQKQDIQLLEELSLTQSHVADLSKWNKWRADKGQILCQQLRDAGVRAGFADDSFDDFINLITTAPIDESQSLTSTIVNNLSDNFNYIGWACGLIVFFFLWLSLGNIELALLSFMPMAVSWVWILGIMSVFGIQFNVVNIILATFIFGQGDDYTIFMTEGCQYEYAYRRKLLGSYKYSIVISALIMFVGIGVLVIAKHPALYSLAEVTVIGMFCVVLMAYLLPPLIFRWLVFSHGRERIRPLTIKQIIKRRNVKTADFVSDCYRYRGVEIIRAVNRRLRTYKKKGYFQMIEQQLLPSTQTVFFVNSGWGEIVMYYAMQMPDKDFVSLEKDHDKSCVARNVAENRVSNISFYDPDKSCSNHRSMEAQNTQAILLNPSTADIESYSYLNPIIICEQNKS